MQIFHSLPAYVGTKMVGAEPMTKGEFEKIFRRVHPDNLPVEAEGYHVQYDNPNGSVYDSWSPKNVFDLSYRLLDGGLTFGDAFFFLKQGKKVARKGWNGKGMYIYLFKWDDLQAVMMECEEFTDEQKYLSTVCMKIADNKILVGWLASQIDMLCEDWFIVE